MKLEIAYIGLTQEEAEKKEEFLISVRSALRLAVELPAFDIFGNTRKGLLL